MATDQEATNNSFGRNLGHWWRSGLLVQPAPSSQASSRQGGRHRQKGCRTSDRTIGFDWPTS